MVDTKIASAINAYKNASGIAGEGYSFAKPSVSQEIKPDFSEMVSQALGGVIESQKTAEIAATNSLIGKTSVEDLAIAINNAELALRTVVSIRDRVIAAYQDIAKMPI